jgi:hypothetical protein
MAGTVQIGFSPDPSMMKNFLCLAGSMQSGDVNWPTNVNALGLPTGTINASNDIFGTFTIPANVTSSTVMVLAWTGTATQVAGALQVNYGSPGFTITSDTGGFHIGSTGTAISASGTNGYIEFTFNGTPASQTVTLYYKRTSVFSGMTQLILCRKSDYNSVLSPSTPGDLISDDYVNAWKALNPKTMRFLQGFDVNDDCNITQRSYLPNWQSSIYWNYGRWIPSLWAGTASGTNTYTIGGATDTPAAYTAGEIIQCNFTNASTSTPITITVAGRGAVPLLKETGGTASSTLIASGTNYTLIYDDLLGGYLVYPTAYGSSRAALPLEILVYLCNRVGCNMWLNLPTHITTQNSTMEPTNSVTQIVSYISSNLTGGDLYLEYSNEVWNFAGSIGNNTNFAINCGTAFGFTSANNRHFEGFYGYKVCVIQPIAKAAWASLTHNLKMVLAFQAFDSTSNVNTYRMQGADLAPVANGGQGNALWVSYTGSANYRTANNRPVDLCDVLAYATYYAGGQCQNVDTNYTALGSSKTITNVSTSTAGQPGVVTFNADPGYSTGTRVNLASITQTGSPTLSGMNVTFTKLTATTYSMYTDATLATPVDTSAFTYTSGGTAKAYPTISGLTSWADQYATGVAASMDSALQSLDADILGSNNGETTSALNTSIYPAWETVAAGYDGIRPVGKSNLTIELYEGALECHTPSTGSCTTLGVSTSYSTTINNLLTAYKNSKYFYKRALTQFNQFKAASSRTTAPAWYWFSPGGNQWALLSGSANDIYGVSAAAYQSYYVIQNLNTARRRFFVAT